MSTRLASYIRSSRESQGYTQAELAARLGRRFVGRTTITAWESGARSPLGDPDLANRLAMALGVPVEDLLRSAGYAIGRQLSS